MNIRHSAPLLITLLIGCADPVPEQESLRPVRTETVFARGGSLSRTFSGKARAGQEIDLSFRVSGRVEQVNVETGDTVKTGHLIAQLEQADFQIAVRQAEANLAQARAAERNAESDLERVRGLWENNNASQSDLDSARARSESAEARVAAAFQASEAAGRQLAYTRLRAPVDGAIASVPVEVNENVQAGQTVVQMTAGTRPEVEVSIPGVLIVQIGEGDPVRVQFSALPGMTFDAVVTEVGVSSTGATTTFPVTVRLTREDADIRSGMSADVTFRFEATDHRERIYLPTHAVGEDRDGRFVFVLDPSAGDDAAVVRRVAVEVGTLTAEGLEILNGIDEGQQVVTAGVRRLSDGQRVRRPSTSADDRP
jgi:RND family efflux transporter MFP subunit